MSERIAIPKLSGNGIVVREVKGDITINPITFIIDDLNDNYSIVSRANGVRLNKWKRDNEAPLKDDKDEFYSIGASDHILYYGKSLLISKKHPLFCIGDISPSDLEGLTNADSALKESLYIEYFEDEKLIEVKELIKKYNLKCIIGRLESLIHPVLYLYIYK